MQFSDNFAFGHKDIHHIEKCAGFVYVMHAPMQNHQTTITTKIIKFEKWSWKSYFPPYTANPTAAKNETTGRKIIVIVNKRGLKKIVWQCARVLTPEIKIFPANTTAALSFCHMYIQKQNCCNNFIINFGIKHVIKILMSIQIKFFSIKPKNAKIDLHGQCFSTVY